MRLLPASIVAATSLALLTPALAQVPTALVDGTMMGFVGRPPAAAWCAVDRGNTQFQRPTATGHARISFPDLTYRLLTGAQPYYSLSGQARLLFTSATAGNVPFEYATAYPADIRQLKFRSYTQSYSSAARLLSIGFILQFPDCGLSIRARYFN